MDEAVEGSDMTNFIPWVFFAWAGILLAGLIALYLPVETGPAFQPKPPAPAAPSWPEMPALWDVPAHVIKRMQPLNAEDHVPVRPYTPEAVEGPEPDEPHSEPVPEAVEEPTPVEPAHEPTPEVVAEDPMALPRPGTFRVLPLWVGVILEDQRRTLEGAADGRPDTGYTYPRAHVLTGAVA
ncbi:hypothetical protein ACWDRR_18005 [Kitasatospora sp. NPDC003701]